MLDFVITLQRGINYILSALSHITRILISTVQTCLSTTSTNDGSADVDSASEVDALRFLEEDVDADGVEGVLMRVLWCMFGAWDQISQYTEEERERQLGRVLGVETALGLKRVNGI